MALREAMISSKSNEWSTPQDLFDALDQEFNFTLDPCSTHENAKCNKHYTIQEDGLSQDWSDEIVFMNPPYGGTTEKWIKKAFEESQRGATVVCLIVNATDRGYWHKYIFPYAQQIRWIKGKLHFNGSKYTAPFGSAIVIFTKMLLGPKQMTISTAGKWVWNDLIPIK